MKTVAIFGVPRSGTSWLGQLFNSSPAVAFRYQPLFSYAFKDRLQLSSTSRDIEEFHKELLNTKDEFILQLKNISGNFQEVFPKAVITHLVWKEVRYLNLIQHFLDNSDAQVIGILRNPKAVIQSWWKAPREFNPEWDLKEEWRDAHKKNLGRPEEFYGYEKWKASYFNFMELEKKYVDRFTIVRYETLVKQPVAELHRLFDFCGLPFTENSAEFIRVSTTADNADPYGVHKIKIDLNTWRANLDPAIIKAIDDDLKLHGIIYE